MALQRRALIIGLMGPALQLAGFLFEVAHILWIHLHQPLSARHILFEPGFLLIFVGLLVTLICVPVAIEVASAREEDVELPLFEPAGAEAQGTVEAAE